MTVLCLCESRVRFTYERKHLLLDAVADCRNTHVPANWLPRRRTISLDAFELGSPERVFKYELPIKTSHGHRSSFVKLEDVETRESHGSGGRSFISAGWDTY